MKKILHTAALLLASCALAGLRPRESPGLLLTTPGRPTVPLRLNANIAIGDAPPTEFLIWAYGPVETLYGTFQFTARSGQLCMAFVQERGNDLFFDYDHAFWADDGAPDRGKAAGWFNLDLRDDGLWATNVRWTPAAAQAIQDKEWRYFSPALDADDSTGEITRLWNIALTNLPATHNMTPLVAANVRDHRTPDVKASVSLDGLWRLLHDALRARHADAWIVELFNDHVVFEYSGKLWRTEYAVTGTGVTLGLDAAEVARQYIPVQGGQTMRTLLTALGLAATATEAEALQTLNAQRSEAETLRRQLLSATGQTDVQAALGVIAANGQAAVQLSAAQVRIQELEGEQRITKLSALIAQGKADRKLTPALEQWAAKQTPEALEAYLQHAPVITQLSAGGDHQPPAPGTDLGTGQDGDKPLTFNGKTWADMAPADKHNLYVDDKATYDALRADHLKRGGQ